jgi:putative transposase
MPNHIHLLWKISDDYVRREVQGALLSYTAHAFKKAIKENQRDILKQYYVDDADRVYQFWERDPMVKECFSEPYLIQKLEYIHNNPFQPHWQLAKCTNDYKFCSASFYESGKTDFEWLVHYRD